MADKFGAEHFLNSWKQTIWGSYKILKRDDQERRGGERVIGEVLSLSSRWRNSESADKESCPIQKKIWRNAVTQLEEVLWRKGLISWQLIRSFKWLLTSVGYMKDSACEHQRRRQHLCKMTWARACVMFDTYKNKHEFKLGQTQILG